MQKDSLSKAVQETLLVILCFQDQNSRYVRSVVELSHFESSYREIAKACYSYIDRYGEAPKDHIDETLDYLIESDDSKKAYHYAELLTYLHKAKDSVNARYALDRLNQFVRHQSLKRSILEAVDLLQGDDENATDRAEKIILDGVKTRADVFEPGTILSDYSRSLRFLDDEGIETFPTGIKEIDYRGLGPKRGGMHLFMAPRKKGKTTWLVNLAKRAMLRRYKVCHITLEMSEAEMSQRYMQSLFAIPKRQANMVVKSFATDSMGRLSRIDQNVVTPQFSLQDPDAAQRIKKKADKFQSRLKNIVIRQFPTGTLTVQGLAAYLDMLEDVRNFIPDLLILDYGDLMKVNADNLRIDLGNVFKDLRGLAVERNLALATATQANREGESSKRVGTTNVSEDISKIATADTVLSFTGTDIERAHGLGRLYVAAARNDEDHIEMALSQNYAAAQFVIDSSMMYGHYHDLVNAL
jgi:replicative DNA helicase